MPLTLKLALVNKLPVLLINPAVNRLPPVTLLVELTSPAVKILPPVILAALVIVEVAEIKPAVNKLPPVIFAADVIVDVAEINPAVKMLPPIILPLAETNPVTYSPVGANTAMLPTPLTDIVTLAAAAEILTLLLPFITFETEVIIPVSCDPLPSIKLPVTFPVAEIRPAVNMFPPVTLPVDVINPAVVILPPIIFAADVIVLVADINPAVNMLLPVMLPSAESPTVSSIRTLSTNPFAPTLPDVFVCRLIQAE